MIWMVCWSSWLEMIRSVRGPKNVSSSNRNGIDGLTPGLG